MSLLKLCNDNLCNIKFTDKPTTIPHIGPPSFLDLVISKNVSSVSKPLALNELSSDHTPISFEISLEIPVEISNCAKADWKKFKGKISAVLKAHTNSPTFSLNTPEDIDDNINFLNELIQKVTEESIPLKNPYEFRHIFSQKIKELIKERNFT